MMAFLAGVNLNNSSPSEEMTWELDSSGSSVSTESSSAMRPLSTHCNAQMVVSSLVHEKPQKVLSKSIASFESAFLRPAAWEYFIPVQISKYYSHQDEINGFSSQYTIFCKYCQYNSRKAVFRIAGEGIMQRFELRSHREQDQHNTRTMPESQVLQMIE